MVYTFTEEEMKKIVALLDMLSLTGVRNFSIITEIVGFIGSKEDKGNKE
jgi:hypothetical protein